MSIKSTLLLFVSMLFLASCQSVSSEEKAVREAAKEKLKAPTTNQRINKGNDNKVAVTGPTTKIQFETETYDFGKINEGAKAKHTYEFTNIGTKPLIIQDAKASCGCTVPTYSKEPVAPGDKGTIDVIFDSKGRPGKTSKYVTVTANTEPVKTKIFLTGEVKPKKK